MSAAHSRTRRGSTLHQLFSEIEKKTALGVNMVIYSLMSQKDATLYERKIPAAIDSRGSIRSGSSVGFGKSVSNRHEQHQEWFFSTVKIYGMWKVKESKCSEPEMVSAFWL